MQADSLNVTLMENGDVSLVWAASTPEPVTYYVERKYPDEDWVKVVDGVETPEATVKDERPEVDVVFRVTAQNRLTKPKWIMQICKLVVKLPFLLKTPNSRIFFQTFLDKFHSKFFFVYVSIIVHIFILLDSVQVNQPIQ